MRDMLQEKGCILNAVINERMQGGFSKEKIHWGTALGVASNNHPVAGNYYAVMGGSSDKTRIAPFGEAVAATGRGNTHEDYVELALQTYGAAWDLIMLRTERYKNPFTMAFIDVKMDEIRLQIVRQCVNCTCTCRHGLWECREVGGVIGEGTCQFPRITGESSIKSASYIFVTTLLGFSVGSTVA